MVDWRALRDVYGPADAIPALLERAALEGDDSTAWNELWGRLCHQGSVSQASYIALPALLEIAVRQPRAPYQPAVHLAAGIVVAVDAPSNAVALRQEHAETIERLRAIGIACLDMATTDRDFLHTMQAVVGLENDPEWVRNLDALANGEAQLTCLSCGEDLVLPLEGSPFLVESFHDPGLAPSTVLPASSADTQQAKRVVADAERAGWSSLVEGVHALLGSAPCPRCEVEINFQRALV